MANSDVEIKLGLDSSDAESDAKSAGKKVGDKAGSGVEEGLDKGSKEGSEKVKKNVEGIGDGLKAALGALSFAAVTASMQELVETTNEFKEDMGKLETAARVNNVAVEDANGAYRDMVGILGETDQSVEALNHIFSLCGDNTQQLAEWTDIAAGVYGTFGDSLPIESLAEDASETAKVSQVTGTFADVINKGTQNAEELGATLEGHAAAQQAFNDAIADGATKEDAYTAALQATSDESERAQMVTDTLTALYKEAGDTYQDVNEDVIEYRQSQSDLKDKMSELGEVLMPVVTDLTNMGTALADDVKPALQWLVDNGDIVSSVLIGIGTAVAGIMVMNAIPGIIAAITGAWAALNAVFAASPIGIVIMLIAGLVAGLIYFFTQTETGQTIWSDFTDFLSFAAGVISNALSGAAAFINGAWQSLTTFMSGIPGSITGFFQSLPGTLTGIFNNAVKGAQDAFNGLVEFVMGIPGRIVGAIGNLGSTLFASGQSLINGFLNGITSAASTIGSKLGGVLSDIRSFFPFSPAKRGPFSGRGYTTYSGKALMRDFGKGIADGVRLAEDEASRALAGVQASLSMPVTATLPVMSGGQTVQYITNDNRQDIAFNQPVQSPDAIARTMRMQQRYGLAGAR